MLSVIYMQMGVLVWFLVDRLKTNQIKLSTTLDDLKATRERLISEEKLAAVGRLASGIAHEISQPRRYDFKLAVHCYAPGDGSRGARGNVHDRCGGVEEA